MPSAWADFRIGRHGDASALGDCKSTHDASGFACQEPSASRTIVQIGLVLTLREALLLWTRVGKESSGLLRCGDDLVQPPDSSLGYLRQGSLRSG